ncbi:MAG: GDCCVxC domain-containing (seleno)protein [Rhodanobacteraceae bacterium]
MRPGDPAMPDRGGILLAMADKPSDESSRALVLESAITCPECGTVTRAHMPIDACQFFWDCPGCGAVLKPRRGDCCVFCSFGNVPCPSRQASRNCCR